jgi:hypothetical protein
MPKEYPDNYELHPQAHGNGWNVWKMAVLRELEAANSGLKDVRGDLDRMRSEMAEMRVQQAVHAEKAKSQAEEYAKTAAVKTALFVTIAGGVVTGVLLWALAGGVSLAPEPEITKQQETP